VKRAGPPKRKKPLRANPVQVRAWEERSRLAAREAAQQGEGMLAQALRRRAEKQLNAAPADRKRPTRRGSRGKRGVGPLEPSKWRYAVWELDGRRSALSGVPVARDAGTWVWQAHHPLPKRYLPDHWKYDPRNGMTLLRGEHERHETRTKVIPWEKLPPRAVEFAKELDEKGILDQSAVGLLLRNHPPAEELAQRPGGRQ
jgi:hypothetical protein